MRSHLFIVTLIIAGCGAQPPIKVPDPIEIEKLEFVVDQSLPLVQQAYSIESEEVCAKYDGTWRRVGRHQQLTCVLPAKDAGKVCVNNSECEVACVADNTRASEGDKVTGVCLDNTDLFGCKAYVSNGVVEPTLCVD